MTVIAAPKNNGWIKFNIHDLVHLRVDSNAPTAEIFKDIFAPFLTDCDPEHFDLTIRGDLEPLVNGAYGEAHGETEFHYNDSGLHMHATDVQIFKENGGFRLNGHQELLVMALPLIDRIMVTKGAAMLHCLTAAYRGHGLLIPAWGGTGKTSTMSKLVKMDDFSFMGDDWAFLTDEGNLLGYAKPMFIKPYHYALYPHLFKKAHKPLVPVALSKPISRLTTLLHPLVTQYPQLASITRRWSPEHMMVMPSQAFPDSSFSSAAPLAAALFVERFQSDSSEPVFEKHTKEWMIARLIGNFNSEMPKQSRVVMTTLGASGLVPIEKAFIEKTAILDKALQDKPCYLLRVPQALSPDQASDIIVDHIKKLINIAGIE